MNQPHDANVTADHPVSRVGDPLATSDHSRGSASTDGSNPGSEESTNVLQGIPGYRVLREIARGGMGKVLAAFDASLDREVALKVLLPGANADRFVRESKITARLPHPGIPPVYALGTLADGSPFLAMKLIAGRTLADEIKSADRPRLMQAFNQVCQAVGFAHSRGVIHRDLKPNNVMVGEFGEVQVMDWGLAKDSTQHEAADTPRSPDLPTVQIVGMEATQTVEFKPSSVSTLDETQAGTILGTPSYMAPEQARGETVDARADVFALGGILCAILTGKPPFSGKTLVELLKRAGNADLAETQARLKACGADAELIALCERCLSPNPADRPADGRAVAQSVSTYLSSVQERLQAAERERAVAIAREAEQRKRRQVTLALAATALLAVILGVGGWLWVKNDRDARTAQATRDAIDALNQAALSREQAKSATTDAPALYARAREQVQRASAIVESAPVDDQLKTQVRTLVAELDAEEKDQRLVSALDAAQLAQAATVAGENRFAQERAIPKFRQALSVYGLPPGQGDPEAVAKRIRERPGNVGATLVAALNDWIDLASTPTFKVKEPNLAWLRAVAAAIEPQDDWTRSLRAARTEPDRTKRREALEKLAAAPDLATLPASSLERLANALLFDQAEASALKVRKVAHNQYSGDFRANQKLGEAFQSLKPPQYALAIRYLTAAVALRPESAGARLNLGNALLDKGEADEAVACLRKAIELDPNYANAHISLGIALKSTGKLNEAINCFRKAIALDPDEFGAQYNLGNALMTQGKVDEAIACYHRAISINPEFSQAHVNLGLELASRGQLDEAIDCYNKALEFQPNLTPAHLNLGMALAGKGKVDEAIACYRKAIEIDPKQAFAYGALGQILLEQGRYAEAKVATEKLLSLLPEKHQLRSVGVQMAQTCERFLKLEERLPQLVRGEEKASTARESLELAKLCHQKRLHNTAVRNFTEAFTAEPRLANDLQGQNLFEAACSAAQASAGQGEDAAKLDDLAKAKLRSQALVWLQADLAAFSKLADTGPRQARPFIIKSLSRWQKIADLASIRDTTALAKLPTQERAAFEKLWADEATLLLKVEKQK